MRRRAHNIGAWLRRRTDDAKDEVKAINAEMADLAEAALAEARRVAANAARSLRQAGSDASGKALALVADLQTTADLLERVVAQTRLRLSGTTPDGATRVVSLHDPDARPIAKGRLGKPVEFGYKAQVIDNVDGIVLDYAVYMGNPGDAALLAPTPGVFQVEVVSADSHAANSTLLSGVFEVEVSSAPPGDGGVGDVGGAEDG